MTPVTKTQIYLPEEELAELHRIAKRTKKTVAQLVREAVRATWLKPEARGPVALWRGKPKRSSIEHDTIYDEP